MLFANDANKDRSKAIVGNVHRMGITNTVISDHDGRNFPTVSLKFSQSILQQLQYNVRMREKWRS